MRHEKTICGFVLILLLTVLLSPACGENVSLSVDPTGRTEGFSAVLYDNRNGLPTADANAIAETGEGFIWIGSYAGLIRYDGITEAFAKVIDMKDRYTNGHSTRVAKYTAMLAKELGYDEETVEKYYRIALLHDIGKIGVPPEVLNKPGKLTDEEFKIIQSHASQGYEALKQITIMPELAIGAEAHHERPDGRGYPNHLKGDEIPRVAQIIAVADCFDAMYSNRPYRNRMNFEKVISIIQEVSGTQLASDVVDAFMRLVAKGEFRAPDDHGGGTTENIDNIHKAQNEENKDEAGNQKE